MTWWWQQVRQQLTMHYGFSFSQVVQSVVQIWLASCLAQLTAPVRVVTVIDRQQLVCQHM
jgi:hypothetical protein